MFEKIKIFSGIEENVIPGMLSCIGSYRKTYEKDEYIILAGSNVTSIGIILSGSANIIKENLAGERVIKQSILKDDMFAHSIVCAGVDSCPVSVVAKEKTEVLFLPLNRVVKTCAASCEFHNKLIHNLVSILAMHNVNMDKNLDYLSAKSVKAKIAKYIIDLADESKSDIVIIPFGRIELADFLSIERSVLSRELSKMKKQGLIDFDKKTFKILDYDSLFNIIS